MTDITYDDNTPNLIKSEFDDVSACVHKFGEALHIIRTFTPTGVADQPVTAKHFGKRSTTYCDSKDYPHEILKNNITNKTLRSHPKFGYTEVP